MAGRMLGMAIEGLATWILLSIGGVPMAGLPPGQWRYLPPGEKF